MLSSGFQIPVLAEHFGFSRSGTGGHLARSMMLSEFSTLLRAVPLDAPPTEYKRSIVSDNVLGKPTFASREKSYRHLVELYGLDRSAALFRVLRTLSAEDAASLPLLAATCAFCRDAQLRCSFELIERLKPGEALSRERMEAHLEAGFQGRFSAAMKKSLAQNVDTTWTASGHLAGKVKKIRTAPKARIASSTYAIFAGYLLGLRGEVLLQSVFSHLVASDPSVIVSHLVDASVRGWLRFRHAGGVIEIDFSAVLTPEELQYLHVSH